MANPEKVRAANRAQYLRNTRIEQRKKIARGEMGQELRLAKRLILGRWRAKKYGYAAINITLEDLVGKFHAWVEMGRHCQLCFEPIDELKEVLDHCHVTGHFRGFLHDRCNKVLGGYESRKKLIDDYIQRAATIYPFGMDTPEDPLWMQDEQ